MKNAGIMLDLKSNMEGLAQSIKSVGEDFDETLHNFVVKASGLIQLNQSLKEVDFTCQVIQEYLDKGQISDAKKLVSVLSGQICSLQCLLAKEIQKSMLKTAEAMAETEGLLIMMQNVINLKRDFDEINMG